MRCFCGFFAAFLKSICGLFAVFLRLFLKVDRKKTEKGGLSETPVTGSNFPFDL